MIKPQRDYCQDHLLCHSNSEQLPRLSKAQGKTSQRLSLQAGVLGVGMWYLEGFIQQRKQDKEWLLITASSGASAWLSSWQFFNQRLKKKKKKKKTTFPLCAINPQQEKHLLKDAEDLTRKAFQLHKSKYLFKNILISCFASYISCTMYIPGAHRGHRIGHWIPEHCCEPPCEAPL